MSLRAADGRVAKRIETEAAKQPLANSEIASSGLDTPEKHGLLDPPRNDISQKKVS
jgi:hypothetical protein